MDKLVKNIVNEIIKSDKYYQLEDFISDLEKEYYKQISPITEVLDAMERLKNHYPDVRIKIETDKETINLPISDCMFYESMSDKSYGDIIINSQIAF